jgi:hypothetical protein
LSIAQHFIEKITIGDNIMSANVQSCDAVKAQYRIHLAYSGGRKKTCGETNQYCMMGVYAPIQECGQNSPQELKALQKIQKCIADNPKNSIRCEDLLYSYRDKFCISDAIDAKVIDLNDYLEKM